MEIRAYAPDDLDAILQLFYDTVHTTCLGDYTQAQVDAWADGHPDRAAWARSLAGHYTLVALLDGVPAGFGDIDATGYLDRLYVRSDAQGRGVATALCARLEAHAAGKAVRVHASITALPFFLRRGYRLVKPQTVFRKGVALNNFILEKPCPASKHTYLFTSRKWMASGTYFPADGTPFPLRGESEVVRDGTAWRLGGFLEACSTPPQRFFNEYILAEGDAPGQLHWTSYNPALGALRGTFEAVGTAIFSRYASEDGAYSGQETLLQRDMDTYDNAGIAYCHGRRMSAWTALLRAAREEGNGR